MEKLSEFLTETELEEFKIQVQLPNDEKCPDVDEFINTHKHLTYIKIDKCTNESINKVFYTLIEVSRKHKKTILDTHGHLLGEVELVDKLNKTPVDDVNLKAKEDINNHTESDGTKETKNKRCNIF